MKSAAKKYSVNQNLNNYYRNNKTCIFAKNKIHAITTIYINLSYNLDHFNTSFSTFIFIIGCYLFFNL